MKRPNIVMILIDDLGWRDLGCYGSSFYETPRLDELAANGVRFTNAYASCPVCSPTRASIMTGKYPARVGLTNFIAGTRQGRVIEAPFLHYLPLTEISIATELKKGGYHTWHVGKWHLGDEDFYPEKHGFDINIGGCHYGMPVGGYFSPWNNPKLPDAEPGKYLTDHLTDKAIELIQNREDDEPFFLNFCHYAVHIPIQSPPELVEKYKKKAQALAIDTINPFVDNGEMPVLPYPWDNGKPMPRVMQRVLQSDPEYAAMIENLDTNIGRLLDTLQQEGLTEDTLVVFVSDNGGLATAEGSPTCNAPLSAGKGWDREGGTRVCQIMHWPAKIKHHTQSNEPVQSCDFYPTFLEAAGLPLKPEQHCDGVSMMPIITGEGEMQQRPLFWHFPHYGNQGGQPAAWVLRDGWKLIHRYASGEDELFHIPTDISEAVDRITEFPQLAAELKQLLLDWQDEVEAKIPVPNPEWDDLYAKVPKVANNAYE